MCTTSSPDSQVKFFTNNRFLLVHRDTTNRDFPHIENLHTHTYMTRNVHMKIPTHTKSPHIHTNVQNGHKYRPNPPGRKHMCVETYNVYIITYTDIDRHITSRNTCAIFLLITNILTQHTYPTHNIYTQVDNVLD